MQRNSYKASNYNTEVRKQASQLKHGLGKQDYKKLKP